MSLFNRKNKDVPEIQVQGEDAIVPEARSQDENETPETGSRKVKLPKTKWY